jgi:hypothetical protein
MIFKGVKVLKIKEKIIPLPAGDFRFRIIKGVDRFNLSEISEEIGLVDPFK